MKNINDELEIMLQDYMPDNESRHIITVDDVVKARQKLKADNTDGSKGLWSNHIIYAPYVINVHLSVVLTSMASQGYVAEELILGTIVSLPKDNHGDLCSSENYRGICLCSAVNKLLEWIIIDRNQRRIQKIRNGGGGRNGGGAP